MIPKVIACAALLTSCALLVSPWVAPKVWAEVSNVIAYGYVAMGGVSAVLALCGDLKVSGKVGRDE